MDLTKLEDEIRQTVAKQVASPPSLTVRAQTTPIPSMSKIPDIGKIYGDGSGGSGTTVTKLDIGKMSAEVIETAHKAAAESLEAMGKELAEHLKAIEALTVEMHAAQQDIKDTVERCREAGKEVAMKVERAGQLTAEVRNTCNDLRKKIENGS